MTEEAQCMIFETFGQLACAAAGSLHHSITEGQERRSLNHCILCDTDRPESNISLIDDVESNVLFSTLDDLIGSPSFQRAKRPRICAMTAFERLLSHTNNHGILNFNESRLGRWCLQALRSSVRELRLAAGFVVGPTVLAAAC